MKLATLKGIHHVTSSSPKIYDFYTNILGMRLVKKNVNQDDISIFFDTKESRNGMICFKGIGNTLGHQRYCAHSFFVYRMI